jgi:hypothetical protein
VKPREARLGIGMSQPQSELSPERRALLARKSQILYEKQCGAGGETTCAESFAVHQVRLGNVVVVHDLLDFLNERIDTLRWHDPEGLLAMTEALAARISRHLENKA